MAVVHTSLRPGGLTFDTAAGRALYILLYRWPDVEHVANALLERGRLSGDEVAAMLDR
jgi:hypothetical protein